MRRAFTIVELLVVLAAVACLLVVLPVVDAVVFGIPKDRGSNIMKEGVNLRNIHLAMATYGGTNKDYFPGLTSTGDYCAQPLQGKYYAAPANARNAEEAASGAGCDLSSGTRLALAVLLEEGQVAPAQLVSPGETGQTSAGAQPFPFEQAQPDGTKPATVEDKHFSYAMLAYGRPDLKPEWRGNQNQQAIVLASRLIFGKEADDFNSVWTDERSGKWKGSVARKDGSTSFESFKAASLKGTGDNPFLQLRYGAVHCSPSACGPDAVGVFGKSGDMAHFGASDRLGMVGSVHD